MLCPSLSYIRWFLLLKEVKTQGLFKIKLKVISGELGLHIILCTYMPQSFIQHSASQISEWLFHQLPELMMVVSNEKIIV